MKPTRPLLTALLLAPLAALHAKDQVTNIPPSLVSVASAGNPSARLIPSNSREFVVGKKLLGSPHRLPEKAKVLS